MKGNYMGTEKMSLKILKPLAWIVGIAVLYFSGMFQYASSMAQGAVIRSGLVNASTNNNSREVFDFDFTIKDLTGKKIDFISLKGKVIFLNLWATWCGPCRSEMPAIQELYNGINKEKIVFVMLSVDKDEHMARVKSYVQSQSYNLPVFMPSGYLAKQLQVPSIPTTFVIAKDGTIALKEVGMKNYNTAKFKKYLEGLAN